MKAIVSRARFYRVFANGDVICSSSWSYVYEGKYFAVVVCVYLISYASLVGNSGYGLAVNFSPIYSVVMGFPWNWCPGIVLSRYVFVIWEGLPIEFRVVIELYYRFKCDIAT